MPQTVAILAPEGRDAPVLADLLSRAGVESRIFPTMGELVAALSEQVGVAIVTEEAVGANERSALSAWVQRQPPWSDLPVLLLTKGEVSPPRQAALTAAIGNVTILERPLHGVTLVSATRSALRARERQRQAEAHIAQIDESRRALAAERKALKASQARLREANERLGRRFAEALKEMRVLADIVERTDAFVQVADIDFRWLAINRAARDEFERIFGVRPQTGDSMLDTLVHLPDHRAAVKAVWQRALDGEEFTEVGKFGDPGRDERWYEMRFNTLRDEHGRRIGAYQFVYDVTERLENERQLTEAQAQLYQASKMETLGQLTGGVAHDFNNLLTPILSALDSLQSTAGLDPRSSRRVTMAMEAAERASGLVKRLLTFARRQHLEARAVDVGQLIEGMRDLIERSVGPAVPITFAIEEALPAAMVDPHQLELALLNLVVNANDAMAGKGALEISAELCDAQEGNDIGLEAGAYTRIAVTDNGEGMDETTLARVAEPFFTTKGVGKGTGLGLSMVHGLAAQSGGALRLCSELGEGTTAEIWLPVAGRAAEATTPTDDRIPDQPRAAVILLVDDDELVARATADMLRSMGHEVIQASSAAAALVILQQRDDLDLLISDFVMPGVGGGDLIRRARALRPELKALLITGYARELSAEDEALQRLAKPYRAAELGREVANLLFVDEGDSLEEGAAPNT